jgi:hypothetical protein
MNIKEPLAPGEPFEVHADCTCGDPCHSVDVGVGVITCGALHCPVHGAETPEEFR